jgi:hypothetical protein
MTRIKQEENLRFSALIRGEMLFCCSIAEFGINRLLTDGNRRSTSG